MKRRYRFPQLSKDEQEYLEAVLLEEMDVQRWFAVAYCGLLNGEIVVSLH